MAILLIVLCTPAKAGFWCDAGCYAGYAVSEIGCGFEWIGDTITCVFQNSEGYVQGTYNNTGADYEAQVRTDTGGFGDCETLFANQNASQCSTGAAQDLDNCLAGCVSQD